MYGSIEIRGARENNLKNISLDIPKRKITVFTGASETYPAFVHQFMPRYGQPDADSLENLSAAITVDQRRLGGNSRSAVATVTDAAQMLRVIFARLAKPYLGSPSLYSFNDPRGMCSVCEGKRFTGDVLRYKLIAALSRSPARRCLQRR